MKRLIPKIKVFFTWVVIIALLPLVSLTCFAQEEISEIQDHGTMASLNLASPSDKSLVFLDLPLGKYRFDTSLQVEQINQNKVSPIENDRGFEQNDLSLRFSIRW